MEPLANDPVSCDALVAAWRQAVADDDDARAQWQTDPDGRWGQTDTGGRWQWQADGLTVAGTDKEWSSITWQMLPAATLRGLQPFALEVTVQGKGEVAGISFGDYKDFLAPLNKDSRRLRFELNAQNGYWAFYIDGRLASRHWWNSAVADVADLLDGVFTLKGRYVKQVRFTDLDIYPLLNTSCHLSVIITCYRFLQRLRVTLRNWCHQTLPGAKYELLVVNPGNPDGTHEHLAAVMKSYPHLNIHQITAAAEQAMNKGALINQAHLMSRGEWIWLTDADCLFSPTSAEYVLDQIEGRSQYLYYGERRHLTAEQTDALLSGRLDGLQDFESLSQHPSGKMSDNAPWGYTQIIHHSTLTRIPYPEEFNHFAHSDGQFVNDCRRHRILPRKIKGLFCLHLDHPFAWFGSEYFL